MSYHEILQELISIFFSSRDPEDIDLYTGIASETHLGSSVLGPTGSCLVAMQFKTLKYGDRFWYETSETSSDGTSLGFTSSKF